MIARYRWTAIAFIVPAVVIYAAFIIYPLLDGLHLSFTNSGGFSNYQYVGTANYAELIADPLVWTAVRNTILYAFIVLSLQSTFGLMIARAIYNRPRIRRAISFLVLLPALVSPVLAAFVFSYIYTPNGLLNTFLADVGLGGLAQVWLGNPSTALTAVAFVNIWMFSGYSAVIFLAGYLGMPAELIDAAQIDGAKGWQRFRLVEWPLLAPALTVNTTLTLIGSLRAFELPLVLTNGSPVNSTTTLALLIYQDIFAANQFAYGITIAVLLLVVITVLSVIANRILQNRERKLT